MGFGFYYRKIKERQRIVEIFQIRGDVWVYIIGDVKYFLFFWMNSIASQHYLADSLYCYSTKYEQLDISKMFSKAPIALEQL